MDPDPSGSCYLPILTLLNPFSFHVIIYSVLLLILLVLSALISGAEVAFFSLGPADMDRLKEEKSKHEKVIRDLLDAPNNLLATILITNNFINVGIVILSAHITNQVFDFFQ